MEISEIKEAITKETDLIAEFEKTEYPQNLREGWIAWHWCQRQLINKGLDEEQAGALIQVYQGKAKRLGTYEAIKECLFGNTITIFS